MTAPARGAAGGEEPAGITGGDRAGAGASGTPAVGRRTALEVIERKRDGGEVPAGELAAFVLGFARGQIPDYQMAAFLMAGCLRGFTPIEARAMTRAMVDSGRTLDLSRLAGPTVDKHSTGGVADGTTLVVAPLAAACGLQVVKLSGHGLGHTGGTLDKLESIPGMRTALAPEELLAQVDRIGLAVAAQTTDLVPADREMYALRDVTGTIASNGLIASSVMSKKIAAGASCILLDVKTGSGAFAKDLPNATQLATICVDLGRDAGRHTAALVTDMSQPLGDLVGNALEIRETVEVLRGERAGRLPDLCLRLTGALLVLAGRARSRREGLAIATRALASGAGLERLQAMIAAQGGDPRVAEDLALLPAAPVVIDVLAPRAGTLRAVDAAAIGRVAARLGAGRARKDDVIDPAVGLELAVKIGDQVEAGAPIGRIFARDDAAAAAAGEALLATLAWTGRAARPPALEHAAIGLG